VGDVENEALVDTLVETIACMEGKTVGKTTLEMEDWALVHTACLADMLA